MEKKKSLFKWDEWEKAALLGEVYEPEYTSAAPSTGIECPNTTGFRGGVCRSHLFDRRSLLHDLPFYTVVNGETRRWVCCGTCGWCGTRRIAKGRPGNGALTYDDN